MQQPKVQVTLVQGDISKSQSSFRHPYKMDSYVEVGLIDRRSQQRTSIGTAPTATATNDRKAVWNCKLDPKAFEIGDELSLRVMAKNFWPRKDAHLGSGNIRLEGPVLVPGGSCEQTVELWSQNGSKNEKTGSMQVTLSFSQFQSPAGSLVEAGERRSLAGLPSVLPRNSTADGDDIKPVSSTSSPFVTMPRMSTNQFDNTIPSGGSVEQAPVSSSTRPEPRPQLITAQYWERQPLQRRHTPVLCTDTVHEVLKRRQGCLCCSCTCATGILVGLVAALMHVF